MPERDQSERAASSGFGLLGAVVNIDLLVTGLDNLHSSLFLDLEEGILRNLRNEALADELSRLHGIACSLAEYIHHERDTNLGSSSPG